MKKFMSLALALCMVFAMSANAFAASLCSFSVMLTPLKICT